MVAGAPATSTVVLVDDELHPSGLWRATPGAFRTDHTGYTEFIQIIRWPRTARGEDGAEVQLAPGCTVVISLDGIGRWAIDETITKAYTISHN